MLRNGAKINNTEPQSDFNFYVWTHYYLKNRENPTQNSRDSKELLKSLIKAANQGNACAQFQLAVMYYSGEGGLSKDYKKSFEWAIKAANQGHTKAYRLLGEIYMFGKGVPEDLDKAQEWSKKAIDEHKEFAGDFSDFCVEDGKRADTEKFIHEQIIEDIRIRKEKGELPNVIIME